LRFIKPYEHFTIENANSTALRAAIKEKFKVVSYKLKALNRENLKKTIAYLAFYRRLKTYNFKLLLRLGCRS